MTAQPQWAPDIGPDGKPVPLHGSGPEPASEEEASRLFRRYSAAELAAMPARFEWLVKGMLVQPTYGVIAGEMKTLKTYTTLAIMLAVASGKPVFDQFPVPQAGPVLAYVGEGGMIPYKRRAERMAEAMGLRLADLPIEFVFETAPVLSLRFRESFARDLKEVQPIFTTLDPLYAYHGTEVKASNLHEEGSLLTSLSSACLEAGSSLLVANHFNQTGNGADLKRITMTGGGEWSDSWLLLSHRAEPDVAAGRFRLRLTIGSRQWGGRTWDLDFNIGAFDDDTGQHDGPITWELRPADTSRGTSEADRAQIILDILEAEPWIHTRAKVLDKAGGNRAEMTALFNALAQAGRIRSLSVPQPEGGRLVKRQRWALATEAEPALEPDPEPVLDRNR